MRKALLALAVLVGVVALAVGGIMALSEAGEVVVLQTSDSQGNVHETRLWVVDDAGVEWLRAGSPRAAWYKQLLAKADVSVTRGDQTRMYRALPLDEVDARRRVNQLMAEKYGLPDRLIGWMADRSVSVPVRLQPR